MINRLFIVFGLVCLAAGSTAKAQTFKIDTKHLTDESFCVVRVNVEKCISQIKNRKEEFAAVARMMKRELPFELQSIKTITFQFGAPDIDDDEPSFAITIEFQKEIEPEKLMSEIGSSAEEKTMNGKSYWQPKRRNGPHLYFESKTKLTAATRPAIEAILKGGGGMGRMASRLKSAPANSELIFIFQATEAAQKSLDMIYKEFSFPLPLDLPRMLKDVESGFGFCNFNSGNPIHLELKMETAAAAEKAKTGMDALLKLGQSAIAPSRTLLKQEVERLEDAQGTEAMQKEAMLAGLEGLLVAEKIVAGSKVVLNEKDIEFDVQHMGGLSEIADLAVSGFRLFFLAVEPLGRAGGPAVKAGDFKGAPKKLIREPKK